MRYGLLCLPNNTNCYKYCSNKKDKFQSHKTVFIIEKSNCDCLTVARYEKKNYRKKCFRDIKGCMYKSEASVKLTVGQW